MKNKIKQLLNKHILIKIYYALFTSPIAWNYIENKEIQTYIKIELVIALNAGIWFTVSVPNKSFNDINIFKALILALESESIGMNKYTQLKYHLRNKKLWQQL